MRRACGLLSLARLALGYQSRLAIEDAPILAQMRHLPVQYPRFDYRRIQVFPERPGYCMSPDRAHRLWRCAELQVTLLRVLSNVKASGA